jgi:kinesin family protein 22
MLSGGNLYQSFGLPGAAPVRRNVINEKPSEGEGDRSGMGFGMTEKEIDERVIFLVSVSILMLISFPDLKGS